MYPLEVGTGLGMRFDRFAEEPNCGYIESIEYMSLLGCPSNALARAGDPGASGECRQEACQQYSWDASLCGDQPVTEGSACEPSGSLGVNQLIMLLAFVSIALRPLFPGGLERWRMLFSEETSRHLQS